LRVIKIYAQTACTLDSEWKNDYLRLTLSKQHYVKKK